MPIDLDKAVGAALPELRFSWTESDVLLYHLSVGAGSKKGDQIDPNALSYTLDNGALQVLPSFGVVAPNFHDTALPSMELPGCEINLARALHGTQEIVLHRPLPVAASAIQKGRVCNIWDKGKDAVIEQEAEVYDDAGNVMFITRRSIFVRGEGGWGGTRGPSTSVELPKRAADSVATFATAPQQALLYRLCGDRNLLHADPAFAAAAGFPTPILHGLCTYGIVLRTVVEEMLEFDATRVKGFRARFAGVVFPGESIRVSSWEQGDQLLVAATITSDNPERDGAPVLADSILTRA